MLPRIHWRSLRAKIIAWAFVPTAIILVAVAWVTFTAYQQVTEALVIERDRELTYLSTSEFAAGLMEYTGLLTEYSGLLADLARTTYVEEHEPYFQCSALKQARSRFEVFDGGVLMLSNQGQVVCTEPERPNALGQDWSDRSYFRQMLRAPGPAFSDVTKDGPEGAEAIAVAVPIIGAQGQFLGVVVGMFRVDPSTTSRFYGDIARLRLGEDGVAYLVDGQGRVIFHSDPGHTGEDFSTQTLVQQVLGGQVGAVRTRDLGGQEIVASFAPVPGTSWGLVTEESWTALTSPSRGYQRFLLLLLALGVVVPAIVVAVGVRRITGPVTELIRAAQEVAEGSFGRKITARTGDEIEELANQFNLMSDQLQASYAHLERRVADRTKELAALNAIASVVSQSLDLDVVLNAALDKTLQVMEIESGGIYLLDEESGVLTLAAHRGFDLRLVTEIDHLKVGEGFSGRVAQSGQPLVVRDVSADSRLTRMVVRDEKFRSLASVPLSSKGKVLGTMFALSWGYREFSDQDVQLLTSIGHQIGMAVESARLFEAEQRSAEQSRVIAEVGRQITSILDIDEVLVQIVHLIQQAFGYDHVGIALVEGDEAVYMVGAGTLWDDPEFRFRPARLKVGEEGITGWVAATGEPMLVPDVSQEEHYVWMRGSKTRSELAVPIKARGEVVGVLDAQSEKLSAFDRTDLTVLQALAHQAAIAIQNARLFDAEQRRAEQFRVISEVGGRITSILAIDELLDQIAKLIKETFDYYGVGIGLVEGDEVVFRAGAGAFWDVTQLHRSLRVQVGEEGITGWVAGSGKPLLVPDVSQEPRYLYVPEAGATRSEICVPLKAKGNVIGTLGAQSDRLDAFDQSDLAVLQSLADQAAIAIENVRLYEQAQQLAVMEERQRLARELHDAVTQTLFSASLIAEALPPLWETDQEEGRQLLRELRQLSRGAMAEMRTLLLELRPAALIEASLGDLLHQLGEAVSGRTGVPTHVSVVGDCAFPSDVHVSLYRIAQEALNNVVKHADASQVTVSLCCAKLPANIDRKQRQEVELQVTDDGRGFDPANVPPDRLGLGIIRERAQAMGAALEIESKPAHGTRIRVVWKEEE
jgi:nitrate/nitrite-specific signal transduction histidine kinase